MLGHVAGTTLLVLDMCIGATSSKSSIRGHRSHSSKCSLVGSCNPFYVLRSNGHQNIEQYKHCSSRETRSRRQVSISHYTLKLYDFLYDRKKFSWAAVNTYLAPDAALWTPSLGPSSYLQHSGLNHTFVILPPTEKVM